LSQLLLFFGDKLGGVKMPFLWTNDLATGNQLVDFQHKQLFQAINNLLDACSQGRGRDQIDNTLNFLTNYTVKHFGDEEKLQQQFKYPDYQNHKKLHDNFTVTVKDLGAQLRQEGPSINLVGKINSTIGTWLVNHIKKEDQKLTAHIQTKDMTKLGFVHTQAKTSEMNPLAPGTD
jgi:hemerythrin